MLGFCLVRVEYLILTILTERRVSELPTTGGFQNDRLLKIQPFLPKRLEKDFAQVEKLKIFLACSHTHCFHFPKENWPVIQNVYVSHFVCQFLILA